MIVALLALSVGAEAGAFLERAELCRFMRMTASERPPCCDLGGVDRFTRVGGDCCKHLIVEASEPAGTVTYDASVPAARPIDALVSLEERPRLVAEDATDSSAYEHPPPLSPSTTSTVLLI